MIVTALTVSLIAASGVGIVLGFMCKPAPLGCGTTDPGTVVTVNKAGELVCDIPVIVSNHPDLEPVAKWFGIDYRVFPIDKTNKRAQEDAQVALLRTTGFCAIHIDTKGYITEVLQPLLADLTQRFGEPVAQGYHGRWLMFDIGAQPKAPEAEADAFLHQPFIGIDYEHITVPDTAGHDTWWWTRTPSATFTLMPTGAAYPVTRVAGQIQAPPCGALPVTVTLLGARPGEGVPLRRLAAPLALEDLQAEEAEAFAARHGRPPGGMLAAGDDQQVEILVRLDQRIDHLGRAGGIDIGVLLSDDQHQLAV